MSKKSSEMAKDITNKSGLRGTITALAIGAGAQYALSQDFVVLGIVGYGIAIWLFVSRPESYQQQDSAKPEQDQERRSLPGQIGEIIASFAVIRKNWRQLSLSEIFSGQIEWPGDMDVVQGSLPERDSADDERDLDRKLPEPETGGLINRFAVIRKNWRQMTLTEVFSGPAKLPNDKEVVEEPLPRRDVLDEEQDLARKAPGQETSGIVNRFAILRKNWRQLSLSEIFSASFESPIDPESDQAGLPDDDRDLPG